MILGQGDRKGADLSVSVQSYNTAIGFEGLQQSISVGFPGGDLVSGNVVVGSNTYVDWGSDDVFPFGRVGPVLDVLILDLCLQFTDAYLQVRSQIFSVPVKLALYLLNISLALKGSADDGCRSLGFGLSLP